jgi:hypothetical protein
MAEHLNDARQLLVRATAETTRLRLPSGIRPIARRKKPRKKAG